MEDYSGYSLDELKSMLSDEESKPVADEQNASPSSTLSFDSADSFTADERRRSLGEMYNLKIQQETGTSPEESLGKGLTADLSAAAYNIGPFAGRAGRMNQSEVQQALAHTMETGEVPFRDIKGGETFGDTIKAFVPFTQGVLGKEQENWDKQEGAKYDLYERAKNGEDVDYSPVLSRVMGKDGRYHAELDENGSPLLDPKYRGGAEAKDAARKAHMKEFAANMAGQMAESMSRAAKERAADISPWYAQMAQIGSEQLGYGNEFLVGGSVMQGLGLTGALGTTAQAILAGEKTGKLAYLGKLGIEAAVPSLLSAAERFEKLTTDDIGIDDKGEVYLRDSADGWIRAGAKAAVGGVAESMVEAALGDVVGKVVNKTAQKAVGPIVKRFPEIGKFFTDEGRIGTAVKNKWFDIVKNYNKVAEMTKFGNPFGEFAEEYAQGALDEVMGLDVKHADESQSIGDFTGEFFDWDANMKELTFGILGQMAIQAAGGHAMERGRRVVRSINHDVIGALKEHNMTTGEIMMMTPSRRIAMAVEVDPKLMESVGYTLDELCRFSGIKDKDLENMSVDDKLKVFSVLDSVLANADGKSGVEETLGKLDKKMQGYINLIDQRSMLDGNWKNVKKANARQSRLMWVTTADRHGNINWLTDDKGERYIADANLGAKIIDNGDGTFRAEHPECGFTQTFNSMDKAADWLTAIDRAAQERADIREKKREYIANVAERLVPTRKGKNGETYGANVICFNNEMEALREDSPLSDAEKAQIAKGSGTGISLGGGKVAMFLDNCRTVGDALYTLSHELGHAGLESGTKDRQTLKDVIKSAIKGGARVDADAMAMELIERTAEGNPEAEQIAAEEGLVYGHERQQAVASPLRRAVTAVKMWMRKRGIDNAITGLNDADYAAIVRAGLRDIKRTDGVKNFGETNAFNFETELTDGADEIEVQPTADGGFFRNANEQTRWISDYRRQQDALEAVRANADAAEAERRRDEEARKRVESGLNKAPSINAQWEQREQKLRDDAEIAETAKDAAAADPVNREAVPDLLDIFNPGGAKQNENIAKNATAEELDRIVKACQDVFDGVADADAVDAVIREVTDSIYDHTPADSETVEIGDDGKYNKSQMNRRTRERKAEADRFAKAIDNLAKSVASGGARVKISDAVKELKAAAKEIRRRPTMPWKFSIGDKTYNLEPIIKRMFKNVRSQVKYGGRIPEPIIAGMANTLVPNASAKTAKRLVKELDDILNGMVMEHFSAVQNKRREDAARYWTDERRKAQGEEFEKNMEKLLRTSLEWYMEQHPESALHDWYDGRNLGYVLAGGDQFRIPRENDSADYVDWWRGFTDGGANKEFVKWFTGGKTGSNDGMFMGDDGEYIDQQKIIESIERAAEDFYDAQVEYTEFMTREANMVADEKELADIESAAQAEYEAERWRADENNVIMSDGTAYSIVMQDNGDIYATDKESGEVILITDNSAEEIIYGSQKEDSRGDDTEDSEGAPRTVQNGDHGAVKGKDGGNRTAAGAPRTADAEGLTLDSATAADIAAEEKSRRDRAEIERRRDAPLKGGTGEVGQTLMDLGGAEGEDLFNRTAKWRRRNGIDDETHRRLGPIADKLLNIALTKEPLDAKWRRAKEAGFKAMTEDEFVKSIREDKFSDGESVKVGAQSIVRRVGDKVVKLRDVDGDIADALRKVGQFNALFPDMAYTIKDSVVDVDGKQRIVLEQPYVDALPDSGTEARRRMVAALRERFGADNVRTSGDIGEKRLLKPSAWFKVEAGPWKIEDLKDLNLGIDRKDGKVKVWDAEVEYDAKKDADGKTQGKWRRITPAEDAAYADAVKRGDSETALRMIREAAAKAMPETKVVDKKGKPLVVYHGTPNNDFTTFNGGNFGNYFLSKKTLADQYRWKRGTLGVIGRWDKNDGRVIGCYLDFKNPLEITANSVFTRILKGNVKQALGLETSSGDWKMPKTPWDTDGAYITPDEIAKLAKENGRDGVIIRNVADNMYSNDYAKADEYISFSPSQIKSADITYDDNGNLIPLSERFNAENADIRWRRSNSDSNLIWSRFESILASKIPAMQDRIEKVRRLAEKDIKNGGSDSPIEMEIRSSKKRIADLNKAIKWYKEHGQTDDVEKYKQYVKEEKESLRSYEENLGSEDDVREWYSAHDIIEILDAIEDGSLADSPFVYGDGRLEDATTPFSESFSFIKESYRWKELGDVLNTVEDSYKEAYNDVVNPRGPFGEPLSDTGMWRRHYTPNLAAQFLADRLGKSMKEAQDIADILYKQGGDYNTAIYRYVAMEKLNRDMKRRGSLNPETAAIINGVDNAKGTDAFVATARALKSREFTDIIREKLQDSLIHLRRMEERYGIGILRSVYDRFDKNYGLVAKEMDDFQRELRDPLAKELQEKGYTGDRYHVFSLHLNALHGAERNRMIAERSAVVKKVLTDPRFTDAERQAVRDFIEGNPQTMITVAPIMENGKVVGERITVADANLARKFKSEEAAQLKRDLAGSGRSTAFWNEVLRKHDADGVTAELTKAVDLVRKMTQRTRDILVKHGRLSAEQARLWEQLSPNYVPMKSDVDMNNSFFADYFLGGGDEIPGGGTKSYRKGEFNRAHGRTTVADDPLAFVIQQYEAALGRAFDNSARQRLADAVRRNANLGKVFIYLSNAERRDLAKRIAILENIKKNRPLSADEQNALDTMNAKLAEANNASDSIPTTKVMGADGIDHIVPNITALEGTKDKQTTIVAFKENGDLKFIKLGGFTQEEVDANSDLLADSDAVRIATEVKKQNMVHWAWTDKLRKLTGWFSAMRTAYTPTFIASNFLADNTQALRNLIASFGGDSFLAKKDAEVAAKFEKYMFHALVAARAVLAGKFDGTKTQIYAKEWYENGGRIGGIATENIRDLQNSLAKDLKLLAKDINFLDEVQDPKELLKILVSGKGFGQRLEAVKRFSEYWNSVVEMSTRIAAYATARDMMKGNGLSEEENIARAVKYSRDVTVNFNRKGAYTPVINALYAFSNATMQDLVRSVEAFGEGRTGKALGILGKRGFKIALFHSVLGFLSAALGFWSDDPDDEKEGRPQYKDTKEFIKQNSISFRVPGTEKQIAVPLRGLMRMPYYLGHEVYEVLFGKKGVGKAAADMTKLAADNLTDFIGAAPNAVQFATPSVLKPAAEIIQNQTFTGSQMYREPFDGDNDTTTVRANMGRGSTSVTAKAIAKGLNWLGGALTPGRKAGEHSFLDMQPEKIEAVWNWIGGGLSRDVTQIGRTIWDIGHLRLPEVRNFPFLSRVVKPLNENSAGFYEARREYDDVKKRFDAFAAEGDTEMMKRLADEHPYLQRRNKRWNTELTDLKSIANNLLKAEQQAEDDETREQIHEWRLKSQYMFRHRLENPPEWGAEDVEEERGHNRIVNKFLKARKREEKKAKREKERVKRGY